MAIIPWPSCNRTKVPLNQGQFLRGPGEQKQEIFNPLRCAIDNYQEELAKLLIPLVSKEYLPIAAIRACNKGMDSIEKSILERSRDINGIIIPREKPLRKQDTHSCLVYEKNARLH